MATLRNGPAARHPRRAAAAGAVAISAATLLAAAAYGAMDPSARNLSWGAAVAAAAALGARAAPRNTATRTRPQRLSDPNVALAAVAAAAALWALADLPAADSRGVCAHSGDHQPEQRLELAVENLRTEATINAAASACAMPTVRATIGYPPQTFTLALNFHRQAPAAVTLWADRAKTSVTQRATPGSQNASGCPGCDIGADFLRAAATTSHRPAHNDERFTRGVLVTVHHTTQHPQASNPGCDGALNLRPAPGHSFLSRFKTAVLGPNALVLLPRNITALRGNIRRAGGALLDARADAAAGDTAWAAAASGVTLAATGTSQPAHTHSGLRVMLWPDDPRNDNDRTLTADPAVFRTVKKICAQKRPRKDTLTIASDGRGHSVPLAIDKVCDLRWSHDLPKQGHRGHTDSDANASLPWFALGTQIAVDAAGRHVAVFPSNSELQAQHAWAALALTAAGTAVWLVATTTLVTDHTRLLTGTSQAMRRPADLAHAETELKLIAVAAFAIVAAAQANNAELDALLNPELQHGLCSADLQLAKVALAAFATAYGTAAAASHGDHLTLRACRTRLTAAAAANATQRLLRTAFEAAPRHLVATALAMWHVRFEAHFAANVKHKHVYLSASQAVAAVAGSRDAATEPRTGAGARAILAATAVCSATDLGCVLRLQVYPTAALLFPAYGNQVANAALAITVAAVAAKHARHANVAAKAASELFAKA